MVARFVVASGLEGGGMVARWVGFRSFRVCAAACMLFGEMVEVIGSTKARVVGYALKGGGTNFVTTNCEYVVRYGIICSLYIVDYGLVAHVYVQPCMYTIMYTSMIQSCIH